MKCPNCKEEMDSEDPYYEPYKVYECWNCLSVWLLDEGKLKPYYSPI